VIIEKNRQGLKIWDFQYDFGLVMNMALMNVIYLFKDKKLIKGPIIKRNTNVKIN